ncbi:MAG: hypothetical protein COV57_02015 [Candidatus Liptonbacteria bacterium CG11_big_fil_rev_8_21_14_0_20_35_14]|uniref:SIMPL domain-containing protein n=1 Tax=Candidatus Liptonbacteria bacterium CG11_big_fil_rev_8_21_14_0_20_35_14 TaxID=1974634 RepID=A0A2H0N7N0_9BACT|nr:MAG: hypothetical protein COV57_02015 [Candidatus Liptonbacteria bacterium CG11_big_fil_rev_8_21_14_0_20_35_14]
MGEKENLFRYLKYFVVFIMLVAVYSFFWGPIASYEDSLYAVKTFTASGEGKVVVEPTIAKVGLSLITEGLNPAKVQADNAIKMNKVIEYLKSKGIEDKDIKTTQFNLNPKYSSVNRFNASYIDGYTLTQEVTVIISDLESVGEIVSTANSLGVNRINSVSFDVTDEEREQYMAEARAEAFEDARVKARSMASSAKVRLGSVISFYENSYSPYTKSVDSYGYGGAESAISVAPSIEPGSQEINVNVNVTYKIK